MTQYDDYDQIEDFDERERVSRLDARMREISGAKGNTMRLRAIIAEQEGIPLKTFERMYYAWRDKGVMGLADKRKLRTGGSINLALEDFKRYAENDKNGSKGGYEAFMRAFRGGAAFHFGTWRDIWKLEYRYEAVPEECPPRWLPKGWTYGNLMKLLAKDPGHLMQLAWTRQGQFAASKYTRSVIRSRIDPKTGESLPVGSIYQADDVWHNIMVYAPGSKGLFQPLEFAFYDVASAYKLGSFMKPRTYSYDEKTGLAKANNLNEFQFRTALAFVCIDTGFHKSGVKFILERGTTAIRENVQRRIAGIPYWGRMIHFETSGRMNTPAHKGMFIGNAGGNPRFKALCEGSHNIMHNATASLLGSRGRDAAHYHESANASERYAEGLLAKIDDLKLPEEVLKLLDLPFLTFDQYCQAFSALEDAVMERRDHRLEGWQNNQVQEWRISRDAPWLGVDALAGMSAEELTAIRALIRKDPENLARMENMSRREVWRRGLGDLVRVPEVELPNFMDPRDAKVLKVSAERTIVFTDKDYYPGQRRVYSAQYTDRLGIPHCLCPGDEVRVYWNPWGNLSEKIWLCDKDDNLLGVSRLVTSAYWGDQEAIRRAAGEKMRDIAQTMAPVRGRHLEEAAEHSAMLDWNRRVMELATSGTVESRATRRRVTAEAQEREQAEAGAFLEQLSTI